MHRFEHGGDIYSNTDVLDFSANINPLGMSDEVVDVLRENVGAYSAYPDPVCRDLVSSIAEHEDIDASWVVCTAGATDLIWRVCLALRPHNALVTAPCYSGYEQALEMVNARVVHHRLSPERGFELTDSFLDQITDATDLVVVASPNNPTGKTISLELIERIVEKASRCGAYVLLDECFLPFTECPSATNLCFNYLNLIVMKAFTKFYALAGVRLGYGICSNENLVRLFLEAGQPWAVSTPAQLAGVAALRSVDYASRAQKYVANERAWLSDNLERLGFNVVAGEANYLMFQSGMPLYEKLLERGILIRRCANYQTLDESWYRIAVRLHDENEQLVAALESICKTADNIREDASNGGVRQ